MQILNEAPEEGLESYVDDFLQSRLQELEELKTGLGQNNFDLLKSKAHNWKGFSRPYGFIKLEELAIELEKSALSKDEDSCDRIIKDVDKYLQIKKTFI